MVSFAKRRVMLASRPSTIMVFVAVDVAVVMDPVVSSWFASSLSNVSVSCRSRRGDRGKEEKTKNVIYPDF